jgi:Ser/Thr protein kinase RdoA (MazF antagonist)
LAPSASKRRILNVVLDEADAILIPRIPLLRQQIIHADYNGKNVLVNPQDTNEVTGIIDFGDAVRSALVADIAFAICRYSLEDAAQMLGAYHSINPLSRIEIEMIFYIVCTRLCMASLVQAWRASRDDPRSLNMDMGSDELTSSLDAIRSIGALHATRVYFEACQRPAGAM